MSRKISSEQVIITSSENLDQILLKISSIDICISDLDDTDAHSPAKIIATDILRYGKNPKYLAWLAKTGARWLKGGKETESKSWQEFIELFLQDVSEIKYWRERFDTELISSTLFPGVLSFYNSLSKDALKVYITRNIFEIALAYAGYLGLHGVAAKEFDKKAAIQELYPGQTNKKRWLVKGDSPEDEEVLDFLQFQERKKRIDYVVGIYVTKKEVNSQFSLNIPQNYVYLTSLLSKGNQK